LQKHPLSGVYAAAVTPLNADTTPDLDAMPELLAFLAGRGCHGALLLGTTGEGPSFSAREREAIWKAGMKVREEHPEFRLLAGTGTPSLDETIALTKTAFDLGYNGVVVLPPYYFRNASADGLLAWYRQVIKVGVPSDGAFLVYHIPQVSGVAIPIEVLTNLREQYPAQFAGLKDSSGELKHAKRLVKELGEDSLILVGNDQLFSDALEGGAAGCITALANLHSPRLRKVWDKHQSGERALNTQEHLNAARYVLDYYPPAPALLKAALHAFHELPKWPVRPPLMPLDPENESQALAEFTAIEK
jgi:4-hydroxy-tetrahydrodipicolinate synthase